MFMISMASIPGRLKNGMLLLSGDVTLLFNPLMCDFGSSNAAVISFKEDSEVATNHGVYLKSERGNVKKFLHKQTLEILKAEGAVDERNKCSIDTGALWLSPNILEKLYGTVDTDEKYDIMVNDRARLSLYGDIAYCLAEESDLENFLTQSPEGSFCDELTAARTALWSAIGQYNMKLLNLSPARFIHFGSIPEIMKLRLRVLRNTALSAGKNKSTAAFPTLTLQHIIPFAQRVPLSATVLILKFHIFIPKPL